MILTDVNVLIYAHREDAADHRRFRDWLEKMIAGPEAFGVAELVLSGFCASPRTRGFSIRRPHFLTPSSFAISCATSRMRFRSLLARGIGRYSPTSVRPRGRRATSLLMRTSPHWRSSQAANGSRRTETTAGSPASAGGIRSDQDDAPIRRILEEFIARFP